MAMYLNTIQIHFYIVVMVQLQEQVSRLLNDLKLYARPVSYISYSVRSNDKLPHDVQLYFGASTDIAVNFPAQPVVTQKYAASNLQLLKAGTKEQPILKKKGEHDELIFRLAANFSQRDHRI